MAKLPKIRKHPDIKILRGRRGRDVVRFPLRTGGVAHVATCIPRGALIALERSLRRKMRLARLARAVERISTPTVSSGATPGDDLSEFFPAGPPSSIKGRPRPRSRWHLLPPRP